MPTPRRCPFNDVFTKSLSLARNSAFKRLSTTDPTCSKASSDTLTMYFSVSITASMGKGLSSKALLPFYIILYIFFNITAKKFTCKLSHEILRLTSKFFICNLLTLYLRIPYLHEFWDCHILASINAFNNDSIRVGYKSQLLIRVTN